MRRFAPNSHCFLGFPGSAGCLLSGCPGAAAATAARARLPCCALLPRRCGMLSRSLFGYHRPTLGDHCRVKEIEMSKGERHGNRETKKPKKDKIKTNAAAPSQKTGSGQIAFSPGKKK